MRDVTRAKIPTLCGAIWRTILNLYASQGVWVNCYHIHQNHWILSIHSNFTNKKVSWLHFGWAALYIIIYNSRAVPCTADFFYCTYNVILRTSCTIHLYSTLKPLHTHEFVSPSLRLNLRSVCCCTVGGPLQGRLVRFGRFLECDE